MSSPKKRRKSIDNSDIPQSPDNQMVGRRRARAFLRDPNPLAAPPVNGRQRASALGSDELATGYTDRLRRLSQDNENVDVGNTSSRRRGSLSDLNALQTRQREQLRRDGATPQQIADMLRSEPNGQRIRELIQLEGTNDIAFIHGLYNRGATSSQIEALLKNKNLSKQQITELTRSIPGDFTPDNILFMTEANGNVGSIYFPTGRIRLLHQDGPTISAEDGKISRVTVSTADLDEAKRKLGLWTTQQIKNGVLDADADNRSFQQKQLRENAFHELVMSSKSVTESAQPGQGERLYEFGEFSSGEFWTHPSRGGPKQFTYQLNQFALNMLYNAAAIIDLPAQENRQFADIMAALPELNNIPMDQSILQQGRRQLDQDDPFLDFLKQQQ